jgi:hypothetical protein
MRGAPRRMENVENIEKKVSRVLAAIRLITHRPHVVAALECR